MSEVDDFLADILPRLREAEIALHNGDAGPRSALWSHDEPVTLFGAEVNRTGWAELGPTFGWLATRFTECTSLEYDIIAAGASGNLAYLVAIERISATVNGDPTAYAPCGPPRSSAGKREYGGPSIGTATDISRTRRSSCVGCRQSWTATGGQRVK